MSDYTTKNLAKNAVWSIANQSVGQVLSLAVFLVTARFVSKEAFGIMAMSMLAVEFFRQTLIESIGTTFYSKKFNSLGEYNAAFALITISGCAAGLILFTLAGPISNMLGHKEIVFSLQCISALLVIGGISKMQEVWLIKNMQFKVLAIRSAASICIGGGIGIVMAVCGYGIASLVVQQIVTALISSIWLWAASAWRPAFCFEIKDLNSVIKQGRFISLNSIVNFFAHQGDVILTSFFLGAATTGVYNAAKRLLVACSIIIGTGLNGVILPALASFADDDDRLRQSYLSGIGLAAFFTAPTFACLSVLAPDLIFILMGSGWAEVAPVLAILAIAGLNTSLNQYNFNIMLIKHKPHWITAICLLEAVSNFLFLLIFVRSGLINLAWAFCIKTVIMLPVVAAISLNLLNLRWRPYLRKLIPPILISGLTAGFVSILMQTIQLKPIINVVLFLPIGGVVYLFLSLLLDRPSFLNILNISEKVLGSRKVS